MDDREGEIVEEIATVLLDSCIALVTDDFGKNVVFSSVVTFNQEIAKSFLFRNKERFEL